MRMLFGYSCRQVLNAPAIHLPLAQSTDNAHVAVRRWHFPAADYLMHQLLSVVWPACLSERETACEQLDHGSEGFAHFLLRGRQAAAVMP